MEIKDYADLGAGDEMGITIEYFGSEVVPEIKRMVELPPGISAEPPSWGQLWFEFKWRLRADWDAFKKWVKSCLRVR